MSTKMSFQRVEKKYLLTMEQYEKLGDMINTCFRPDEFYKSTICNIYYDTPDFSLIRRSLEKPVYKEKLRVRSYGTPDHEDKVFVEIKKKYKGIVYKRRLAASETDAVSYLEGNENANIDDSQIHHEIDWFLRQHEGLEPKMYLAYDRLAYAGKENKDLRITFDKDIRYRMTDLDLTCGDAGELLLDNNQILMEIKIPGAAPLWLSHILSDLEIYPTSFSKYGSCYSREVEKATSEGKTGGIICA